MELIRTEVVDHIGIITLNRQEAANALSHQLLLELRQQLNIWSEETKIRVLIITGSGEKVFSAGADLKERAAMNEKQVRDAVSMISNTMFILHEFPKPVIGAINGIAIGGGFELALACDLRVASENASFALTETSLGIIPGAGGTQLLPKIIGIHKAKEMVFTGKRLSAQEALQEGLVLKVTYRKELVDAAMDLAYDIAQRAPLANYQAKIAMSKALETSLDRGMDIEREAYEEIISTKDRLEGLAAFQEKRPAKFTGE
ncbi:enoyl-CoA hydratase-related protein [Salipaludibacillus sp. CF4.18]|uniref:enoyl-CoA hydratase-related protein n=1 Tax=Salipaludibacillus sp. CF4.18 TaxID=3373081 RepID=UPI003EE77400